MVTRERVLELFDYDPKTGYFWRKERKGRCPNDEPAGCTKGKKYRNIKIDYKDYNAARLAFLVCHGRWPTPYVDHINGDRFDDRICNLREVTPRQNCWNNKKNREQGGTRGVCFRNDRRREPWVARIRIDGELYHLGSYETRVEAMEAYESALMEMP